MSSFRDEIFQLCKKLNSMEQFSSLRQTMHELRFLSSENELYDPKRDICFNGILLRAEFYGILLAYEKKLISIPSTSLKNTDLSEKEKKDLVLGHSYISKFISLCLEEIKEKNCFLGNILSPYSFLFPIENVSETEIDVSLFHDAVDSFKSTSVYRSIIETNALQAFTLASEEMIRNLFGSLYKEIIQAPTDCVPKDIILLKDREKSWRPNQQVNAIDALQLISFKLLALREMLSHAASLLYDSILGSKLLVIDENKLINIEKNSDNTIYSYRTILLQGSVLSPYNDMLNRVFLFHFEKGPFRMHEFGRASSMTTKFANENGDTTKLTYCTLDEELNPISNLTKR